VHYPLASEKFDVKEGRFKVFQAKKIQPEPPSMKKEAGVLIQKKPTCYETVSSAHHRVQSWLEEKTSKYPVFFRHLRVT